MIEYAPRTYKAVTYNQAFLYTITLTHNNHKDWRLPTTQEYLNRYTPVSTWYEPDELQPFCDDDHYFRCVLPVRTL